MNICKPFRIIFPGHLCPVFGGFREWEYSLRFIVWVVDGAESAAVVIHAEKIQRGGNGFEIIHLDKNSMSVLDAP